MSVVEQDYPNLEVVVSDDGSNDGTIEAILDCAQMYPGRVVPLVNGPHLGITGNCNRALGACRGKYIAFQGGDDIFLPGKISNQVAWFEVDERRVLCGHKCEVFDSTTGRPYYISSANHIGKGASAYIKYGNLFLPISIMVRASCIPSTGFNERIKIGSDWHFFIECLADGGTYGFIEGVYARYRRNVENISEKWRTDVSIRTEWFEDNFFTLAWFEVHYPEYLSSCTYNKSIRLLTMGKAIYFQQQNIRLARQYLINSLRYRLNYRVVVWLVLTYMPIKFQNYILSNFLKKTPMW